MKKKVICKIEGCTNNRYKYKTKTSSYCKEHLLEYVKLYKRHKYNKGITYAGKDYSIHQILKRAASEHCARES